MITINAGERNWYYDYDYRAAGTGALHIKIKENFLEPALLVINIILILQDKHDRKLHRLEMDIIF